MQSIPGMPRKGNLLVKLLLLLILAAVAAYFLAKFGVISLPFKLPF